MLTDNQLFQLVVDKLLEHGPEETRARPRMEVELELTGHLETLKNDEDGPKMAKMFMDIFKSIYEAGRKAHLDELSDDERVALFHKYCIYCGRKEGNCYCCRDD